MPLPQQPTPALPCPIPSLALWRACERPPCLPSPSQKPPEGPEWVHEIKHDGYRLIARRQGDRIRLYTRRGYDWSGKYPWIVEALLALGVIDGEGVWANCDTPGG